MAAPVAPVAPVTQPAQRRTSSASRAWRALLVRLLLAVASGFVLYLSFAPRPLWWLAPIAFAGLGLVLHRRRFWGGLGYGFVFGLAFFLPLLTWLQDFLGAGFGPWPWLALSATMALYLALSSGLITVVARLPVAPVWMALVIIAGEALRGSWPAGGFPWGRVAFSQPEGAFLSLASFGGAPLVGFAVALTGFGLAALVLRLRAAGWRPSRPLIAPALVVLVPVVAGLGAWPTVGTGAQAGTLTVAAVQGNAPNVGLGLLNETPTLRANHLEQTDRLVADIRSGAVPRPDLVVWPETATDVRGQDPVIDRVVADLGVPTLVGARYRPPGTRAQNSEIVWEPRTGPGQRYAKQQLVPFAEFVPMRSIARWFTPFVDDTGDMLPGTSPAVLDAAGTRLATPICYEVAYDHVARDATNAGARLLAVPTNNAWYGYSEMSYQQLAMTRLRTVEHGRAAVVAATSGVSAIIRPDGSVAQSTSQFTAASLVAQLPLRQATTLSDRLGAWTEYVLVGAAVTSVLAGFVLRFRTRRAGAGDTRTTAAD